MDTFQNGRLVNNNEIFRTDSHGVKYRDHQAEYRNQSNPNLYGNNLEYQNGCLRDNNSIYMKEFGEIKIHDIVAETNQFIARSLKLQETHSSYKPLNRTISVYEPKEKIKNFDFPYKYK